MRVSVIGAGAIGGWLTAGFIEAGATASVLARGATLQALQRDGLGLDDGTGLRRYPVDATGDPGHLRGADILLLGLKAHDLPGAAPLIEAAVGPDTVIVPAINGLPWWFFDSFGGPARGLRLDSVDPGGKLARLLPADRVVGTVVHAASQVERPGTIRLGVANKVWMGDAGSGRHAAEVARILQAGGIPAEVTRNLHWHVWDKLWGNANMNPLSALTRADTARMLGDDHLREVTLAMMREMAELGARIGLDGFSDPERRIAKTRSLGPIRTSMLQDVEAGRDIEIEPILGGLVALARHLGQPTPMSDAVYGLARMLGASLRG